MSEKNKTENQRILYKDNILVKTKYELNLVENKLYNLLLYKFQREGNLLKCTITQEEIKEVIKNKETNTVKGITTVLNKLSSKKILIEEIKQNKKNSLWHNYNLINGYTYDDEFNTFEIQATEKIYDLLKQKFKNGCYTPSNLNIFLTLNNYYSQRLYELLRLWSNTKTVINYKIEDLKEYLMLQDSYPEYGNFKRRIITPAIKELNKNGFFEITISENKSGRKVESIDFFIKDLDKRKYFDYGEIAIDIDSNESKGLENKMTLAPKEITLDNNENLYPKETILNKSSLRLLNMDFKGINFTEGKLYMAYVESEAMTMEKDNVDIIKTNSYKYFKTVLKNKLIELEKSYDKKNEDIENSNFNLKEELEKLNI